MRLFVEKLQSFLSYFLEHTTLLLFCFSSFRFFSHSPFSGNSRNLGITVDLFSPQSCQCFKPIAQFVQALPANDFWHILKPKKYMLFVACKCMSWVDHSFLRRMYQFHVMFPTVCVFVEKFLNKNYHKLLAVGTLAPCIWFLCVVVQLLWEAYKHTYYRPIHRISRRPTPD